MKKLAVAAAFFGVAKRESIKNGESQIPPPIPTDPAMVPKMAPTGIPITVRLRPLKFLLSGFLFSFFVYIA